MSDQRDGGIAWTEQTWNPVRGCSRVSPGCENCYAERVAARFSGEGQPYHGLAVMGEHGPRWTREVQLVVEHLADPLRWKRPRRVFVNSMSDLFHEGLKDEEIAAVFGIMAAAPTHTFQVLTKRAERMREWFAWLADRAEDDGSAWTTCLRETISALPDDSHYHEIERNGLGADPWPFPNVWLGVSVEDQQRAEERIPHLLATPAAVRFISAEPLLGPIDLASLAWGAGPDGSDVDLDWAIVGGESGPGARPCKLEWIRTIVARCYGAGCSVFVKQLGAAPLHGSTARRLVLHDRKGGDMSEWPADLRIQEFPR